MYLDGSIFHTQQLFLVLYPLLRQCYWGWHFLLFKWQKSKGPVNKGKMHLKGARENEKWSFNAQNYGIMNHETAKQIKVWVNAKWKDTAASDLEKMCAVVEKSLKSSSQLATAPSKTWETLNCIYQKTQTKSQKVEVVMHEALTTYQKGFSVLVISTTFYFNQSCLLLNFDFRRLFWKTDKADSDAFFLILGSESQTRFEGWELFPSVF